MTTLRFTMFVSTLLFVLVFSAVNTVTVFADEENPPLNNPIDVIPPISEDSLPIETEAPLVENQNTIEETLPINEGDEQSNNLPNDETAEPVSLSDLLSEMPEGTDVIVTNSEGEVVPLATEEAERLIAIHDPIWCPVGVAPNPNNPACSASAFTLFDLINNIPGEPYTAGIIWIQAGQDFGWNTVIDDSWGTNSENYNLTLQGGWNGIYGSTALDPIDPYSYFDTKIEISGWIGNIIINNIIIDTNPTFSTSPANHDYALYIQTLGSITLNNVTVENNINTNTNVANCSGNCTRGGAYLNSGGNVTVNNSYFNNNEGAGLVIETTGNVVTNNIVAISNGGRGVYIDNTFSTTAKSVTMKGLKQFVGNGASGLVIYSNGAVTLSNLVATNNLNNGVFIDNTFGMYLSKPVYANVTITGSNLFNNNLNNGLVVYSLGAISVSNITALWNGSHGAYLDNCFFGGTYNCFSKSPKPITVSGVNILNHNQGNGLEINTAGGAISISSVIASYNNFYGVYADNRWMNYYGNAIAGTWKLTGYGVFNGNGDTGLVGWSYGPMTLSNVTANNNGWRGAYLRVTNTFTLTGYGEFNNNSNTGLHLQASSTISLRNINANNNNGYGAYIYAWRAGPLGANVTFKGTNVFNNNGGTNHIYDGLHIETDGLITLSNISANYNAQHGAELCNYTDSAVNYLCGTNVNSSALIGNTTQGVVLTGFNTFNGNWENGLLIQSNGAIRISNLTADNNGQSGTGGSGAVLDNYQGGITVTPQIVILTGFVNVNYNYGQGLDIQSIGAVTLSNVTATNNITGTGVFIDNGWISSKQSNVTITGLNNQFNTNGGDGLYVYSYGAITISNIYASWNGGDGVYLYNFGGLYAKPITINGTNNFSWNYYNGLYINSAGAVTLNRLTAVYNDRNLGDGYNASGIFVSTNGAITLTCGFAYGNYNYGIYLNSSIKVTLKGWYSYGNGINHYFSSPNTNTRICLLP